MTLDEYQDQAMATAVYKKTVADKLSYAVIGLCGEAGELANKLKKVLRDHGGVLHGNLRAGLAKELGGVLWYCAAVADELGHFLDDIAELNLRELAGRKDRGTLQGNGDDR